MGGRSELAGVFMVLLLVLVSASPVWACSISTEIKDADGDEVTEVLVGTTVHDTATLHSPPGTGGTVTYRRYTGDCSSSSYVDETVTVTGYTVPSSSDFTPSTAGRYSYKAHYERGESSTSIWSSCEALTVKPTITTTIKDASGSPVTEVAVDTTVHDTAVVTGPYCHSSGGYHCGTVTYQRYSKGDCSGSHVDETVIVTSGGIVPDSSTFTPTSSGEYSYKAIYDHHSYDATSACEPLTVKPADVCSTSSQQPTYGTANVDGDYSEWNLAADWFADMHEAWKPAPKPILSKLYLRYDCHEHVLYVLVLAETGVTVDIPGDQYLKVASYPYDPDDYDKLTPLAFAWVGQSGDVALGWEASYSLDPGWYRIKVHASVNGGATSGTVDEPCIYLNDKCAIIQIVKTADAASVPAGESIGFTIEVKNTGEVTATGVTINDPLPGNTATDIIWTEDPDKTECSITGSPPGQTLTCDIGDLGSGESFSVHVTSSTTKDSCGVYDNKASVTTTNNGEDSSEDKTEVLCAFLKIVKVTVGGDETFGFTVAGPTPSTPSITTSGGTGTTDFFPVDAGIYTVTESTIPPNWNLEDSYCSLEGSPGTFPPTDFEVPSGGSVTCTFKNSKLTAPSIRTELSDSVITLGESVSDSVILTGVTADPEDTVTYNVYDDPYCSGGHLVFSSTKTVVTSGVLPDSDPFTPTVVGHYEWQVTYTGLLNHITLTDTCGNEPLEVRSGQPPEQPPVGGEVYVPNKLVLLKPYLAILGLLGAVATAVAITRGRRP